MGTSRRDQRIGNAGIAKWEKMEVFKATSDNTYRIVESAEPVMKTSEFLGCHEHDVSSLTWPLYRGKSTTVSKYG
jgi:hypothetical protein